MRLIWPTATTTQLPTTTCKSKLLRIPILLSRFGLLLLFSLAAVAADNAVRIYEAATATQNYRPTLISHQFRAGEIPTGYFPKPYIGGTASTAWQTNVLTTWPDGSAQWALISLRLSLTPGGSAVIDFRKSTDACYLGSASTCLAAALTQTQMLNYDTGGGIGSWDGQIEGTLNSVTNSANVRTMMTAGKWSCWACGPVLNWVIVEDRSSAWAYNFGWQYSGGAWTQAGSDTYKSLLPVFGVQFWPDCDGGGPITAWPGVEIEAALYNGMTSRLQRIPLDSLVVKVGTPTLATVYTQAPANFIARRQWHTIQWAGAAPGAIQEDHNLAHLIGTRLLPSYDLSLVNEARYYNSAMLTNYASRLGSDKPEFCTTNVDYCALWTKATATTGQRGDLGILPQWYVDAMYIMGDPTKTVAQRKEIWDKFIIGQADAGTSIPFVYIEADTGRSNFGSIVSLQTRPTIVFYQTWDSDANTGAADRLTYACAADPCNGYLTEGNPTYGYNWQAEGWGHALSHNSDYWFVPTLLTGRWFYSRAEQYWAAFSIGTNITWYRGWGVGVFNSNVDWRGIPWALRNIMMAYMVTPDADTTPKNYFKWNLAQNELMWEGYYNILDGNQAPYIYSDPTCAGKDVTYGTMPPTFPSEPWCIGRKWWTYGNATGPTYDMTADNGNPLRHVSFGSQTSYFINALNIENPFFFAYGTLVFGWLADGGFIQYSGRNMWRPTADKVAEYAIGEQLAVKNYGLHSQYESPYIDTTGGGRNFFSTWSAWEAAHGSDAPLDTSINASATSIIIQSGTALAYSDQWLKIDSERIIVCSAANNTPSTGKITLTVCTSGRGAWGTTAASHTAGATVYREFPHYRNRARPYSYTPIKWRAMQSWTTDYYFGAYGSGLKAFERGGGTTVFRQYDPADTDSLQDPYWAFKPRDEVRRVRVEPGTGTLTLRWVAPSGAACRVYVGASEPTVSDDAADAAATVRSREQYYTAGGLSAGTNYYRISCGTARISGTATVN